MRIADMHWAQVEARAAVDDRAVLPVGSIEQHAFLSLATDQILAERVAEEAAAPLGVPVFPCLPYGLTAGFIDYPGSITLRAATYAHVIRDLLDGIRHAGFKRILFVNGHGGNTHMRPVIAEWLNDNRDASVKLHDWWRAPRTMAKVIETDPDFGHASWMENFPWTRLPGTPLPNAAKPQIDHSANSRVDSGRARAALGDGNYGGVYQRSDAEMQAIWDIGVEETRAEIENGWH